MLNFDTIMKTMTTESFQIAICYSNKMNGTFALYQILVQMFYMILFSYHHNLLR